MQQIPFFYFDILARILPGAFFIAMMSLADAHLPDAWRGFLFGGDFGWQAVAVPAAGIATAYLIGLTAEASSYLPVMRSLTDWLTRASFDNACRTYERNYSRARAFNTHEDAVRYRCESWDRLVRKADSGFSHAHRFQAEAKLFWHLSILTFVTVLYAVIRCLQNQSVTNGTTVVLLAATTPALVWASYARESRRWLQVLIFDDRYESKPLPAPPMDQN